jgi:hypothetical protein
MDLPNLDRHTLWNRDFKFPDVFLYNPRELCRDFARIISILLFHIAHERFCSTDLLFLLGFCEW